MKGRRKAAKLSAADVIFTDADFWNAIFPPFPRGTFGLRGQIRAYLSLPEVVRWPAGMASEKLTQEFEARKSDKWSVAWAAQLQALVDQVLRDIVNSPGGTARVVLEPEKRGRPTKGTAPSFVRNRAIVCEICRLSELHGHDYGPEPIGVYPDVAGAVAECYGVSEITVARIWRKLGETPASWDKFSLIYEQALSRAGLLPRRH